MKKTLLIVISFVLVIGLLAGCTGAENTAAGQTAQKTTAADSAQEAATGQTEELPVLRLGSFNSRPGFIPWYIAENKLDEQNGFKLQLEISTAGGAFLNEAIGAGLLDATIMGSAQGVFTANTYNCKLVAETSESNGGMNLFAAADSPQAQVKGSNPDCPDILGDAATLKGKKFMYPVGSMSQLGVAAYLEKFGLKLEDVESVNMNYGPGYQALQAGEGDVSVLFSPLNYTALTDGYVKLASMDQLGVSARDLLMVTPETYENPEMMAIIQKLVKLIYECNDKFQADQDLQIQELIKFHEAQGADIPDPENMLKIEVENMYLITTEQAKKEAATMGESCAKIAEFYTELGSVEENAAQVVRDSVDRSIVEGL